LQKNTTSCKTWPQKTHESLEYSELHYVTKRPISRRRTTTEPRRRLWLITFTVCSQWFG